MTWSSGPGCLFADMNGSKVGTHDVMNQKCKVLAVSRILNKFWTRKRTLLKLKPVMV